jgi:hypothetical protein
MSCRDAEHNSKRTLLFVDDHEDQVISLKRYLYPAAINTSERFEDCYQIEFIRGLPRESEGFRDCLDGIVRFCKAKRVWMIFVDIVLAGGSRGVDDTSGLAIGNQLMERLPFTPVVVYTEMGREAKVLSASVEHNDAIFPPRMLPSEKDDSLTVQQFIAVLSRIKKKKRLYLSEWNRCLSVWDNALDLEVRITGKGGPKRLPPMHEKAVRLLAKLRFGSTTATSVELERLSAGFSGAYLFKATGNGMRTQVLKINENPRKLEDEAEGFARIRNECDIPADRVPISLDPLEPTKLAEDWWAAIGFSYEKDYSPLLEIFSTLEESQIRSFFSDLWSSTGLETLYKKITPEEVKVGAIIREEDVAEALEELGELARYFGVIKNRLPGKSIDFDRLMRVLNAVGSKLTRTRVKLAKSTLIHGDLNCRNILVNPADLSKWVLIDFPHTGAGYLAQDFAKSEVELIGIVMDRASGRDIDLDRLAPWLTLTDCFSKKLSPDRCSSEDEELERIAVAVGLTRKRYSDLRVFDQDRQNDYFVHLVAHALRSITYPDLTVPKRLLLAIYCLGLIEHIDGR